MLHILDKFLTLKPFKTLFFDHEVWNLVERDTGTQYPYRKICEFETKYIICSRISLQTFCKLTVIYIDEWEHSYPTTC